MTAATSGVRMAGVTGKEVRVHGGTMKHRFVLLGWIYARELWQGLISNHDEGQVAHRAVVLSIVD